MFSKIVVTFCATQPAMAAICQVSGSAIATVPTTMRPSFHSQIANAAVATTIVAFSSARQNPSSVVSRTCRRSASV